MNELFELLEDSLNCRPVKPQFYDQETEEMEEFIDNVMFAADMAAESRGFFMITVSLESVDGKLAYVPRLFAACADDDIATIIQSEIWNIAAITHDETPIDEGTSFERLRRILRKRKNP